VGLQLLLNVPSETKSEQAFQGDSVGSAGPLLHVLIRAGGTERKLTALSGTRQTTDAWTFADFFGKPWGEIVKEGSPYFPQGDMAVSVAVHFISPQNAAEELPF
jgi:hypothetical protein